MTSLRGERVRYCERPEMNRRPTDRQIKNGLNHPMIRFVRFDEAHLDAQRV